MIKIAIIVGSTRPGRKARDVARWVQGIASDRTDAAFELVDIKQFNLPLLDEPVQAAIGPYSQPHTKAWAAKIAEYDGFVFVTPEYNHAPSAALKNAIDYLYREWNNKAVGFVGYGGGGGVRAVEQLRQIVSNLELADVRVQVGLSLFDDFENRSILKPRSQHKATVDQMLDQVVAWSNALKPLRKGDTT